MTLIPQNKSYLLPALLWLGAFVCALYPVNAVQYQLFMASVILTFVWAISMVFRDIDRGWNLPRSKTMLLAGLFSLLVLCSAFWSEVKSITFTGACLFAAMPLTFFAGVMGGSDEYFKKLRLPLMIIFVVLCVWAIFQFFFLNTYFHGQARHPLADPSSLGALFSLALFCSLGWMVSAQAGKQHKLALILSILLVWGIMSTVSRGPVLAFLPGIALFAFFLWPSVKARRKSLALVALSALAFYGLMQTGLQKEFDLGQRLLGSVDALSPDMTNNRIDVWKAVLHMIKDRPLLGTGYGTFHLYYPEYRLPTEIDGVLTAHNDPLQFWVELGILGPVLFYGFVISCTLRTFAALKRAPSGSADRVIVASIFAALAASVTQSHVSFNHYNLSILMITGLLLSVWFVVTGRILQKPARVIAMPENMPHNLNRALVILPFLMTGWLFVGITGGECLATKAQEALYRQDMDAFLKNINMADRVSMRMNYRTFMFAVNVPIAILQDRKDTLNEEQQKKLFEQVKWYMDDASALNPRSPTPYYYMAKVQSLVSPSILPPDLAPPEELYKRALEMEPTFVSARLELLKIYQAQGKSIDEQIALLEPAANFYYMTTSVMDYYGALSNLYLEKGNYGKVKEVMLRAAEFQKRSDYSLKRQNTSIPQAVMGGDADLPKQ